MTSSDRDLVIEYVAKLMYLTSGAVWQWALISVETKAEWTARAQTILNCSGISSCLDALDDGEAMRALLLRAHNSRHHLDARFSSERTRRRIEDWERGA